MIKNVLKFYYYKTQYDHFGIYIKLSFTPRKKLRNRLCLISDNDLFNSDNATTVAPVLSSSQQENQETTRVVVTDYLLGNTTVSTNETSPLTNKSSSVAPDEKITESANATFELATSTTISSGNGSVSDVEIQRHEVDDNNGLHIIYPAVPMNPGTYSLEVDYEITFDGKAIYSVNEAEGK